MFNTLKLAKIAIYILYFHMYRPDNCSPDAVITELNRPHGSSTQTRWSTLSL